MKKHLFESIIFKKARIFPFFRSTAAQFYVGCAHIKHAAYNTCDSIVNSRLLSANARDFSTTISGGGVRPL